MIILRQHNYSLFNINYLKGIYDLLENVYGCSPYDSFWQLYPGDEKLISELEDIKKDINDPDFIVYKAYKDRNDRSDDNYLKYFLEKCGKRSINVYTVPICKVKDAWITYLYGDKDDDEGFYKITIKDQKYEKLKSLKDGLKQYYKSQKINKLKL